MIVSSSGSAIAERVLDRLPEPCAPYPRALALMVVESQGFTANCRDGNQQWRATGVIVCPTFCDAARSASAAPAASAAQSSVHCLGRPALWGGGLGCDGSVCACQAGMV